MDHLGSIYFVKQYLEGDDPKWDSAAEAFSEIPNEDQELIWKAPKKGGFFTTKEREQIKSTDFNQAMKRYLNDQKGESNEWNDICKQHDGESRAKDGLDDRWYGNQAAAPKIFLQGKDIY